MRIHEDPHVNTRPPRIPKSSPIVDTSNTRPLTIERRSVSEKLPPKVPRSDHSAAPATPKSSSHFLSEFNVDDCFDFRSIPDPPSPEPRNRRRLSTPIMHSTMTQSQSQSPDKKSSSRGTDVDLLASDDESLPRGTSKRSRKSLCHVPSPLVREQRDDPSPPNSPSRVAPKTLQVNICIDDDDDVDDATSASVKRRKKRQSMELPRELVVRENADASRNSLEAMFAPPRASIPSAPSQSRQDLPKAFIGDMQNMNDLRALVRGFCRVPREDRSYSRAASIIEQITGYPLVTPEVSEHPQSHANRRSVIQKMGPIIEEIDKRKAEEIAKWEYETDCRVERSAKSGKYRYISLVTNTKVGSHEYKRRYMGVLAREASWRLAKTNEWKDKLNNNNSSSSRRQASLEGDNEEEGTGLPSLHAQLVTDSSSDMDECENTFDATQELDLDLNDILGLDTKSSEETEQEPLPAGAEEDDTSMEICDMSVSMDLGEASDVRVEFEPSARMNMDTTTKEREQQCDDEDEEKELQQVLGSGTTISADEDDAQQEQSETKVVPKSVTPTEMELLPLPDRDEESKDPDIAQAERRLWGRIDAALQDFSQEVMMIMNSKSAGTN